MIVFRLSKNRYAGDLSGKGAEKAGGRWNSKGVPMVYTCESRALCTLELTVHIPLAVIPDSYSITTLEFPDIFIEVFDKTNLPMDWKSIPHGHSTQETGDRFIEGCKTAVLKVPSAIVPDEYNYLINPVHPEANKIKIVSVEEFAFDERLFV